MKNLKKKIINFLRKYNLLKEVSGEIFSFNFFLFTFLSIAYFFLGEIFNSAYILGTNCLNLMLKIVQCIGVGRMNKKKVVVIREGIELEVEWQEVELEEVVVLKKGCVVLFKGMIEKSENLEILVEETGKKYKKKRGDEVELKNICIFGSGTYKVTKIEGDEGIKESEESSTFLEEESERITKFFSFIAFSYIIIMIGISLNKGIIESKSILLLIKDRTILMISSLRMIPLTLFVVINYSGVEYFLKLFNLKVNVKSMKYVEKMGYVDTFIFNDIEDLIYKDSKIYEIIFLDSEDSSRFLYLMSDIIKNKDIFLKKIFERLKRKNEKIVNSIEILEEITNEENNYYTVRVKEGKEKFWLYLIDYDKNLKLKKQDMEKIEKALGEKKSNGKILLKNYSEKVSKEKIEFNNVEIMSIVSFFKEFKDDFKELMLYLSSKNVDIKMFTEKNSENYEEILKEMGFSEIISMEGEKFFNMSKVEKVENILKINIFCELKKSHKRSIIDVLNKENKRMMIFFGKKEENELDENSLNISFNYKEGFVKENVKEEKFTKKTNIVLEEENFLTVKTIMSDTACMIQKIRELFKIYATKCFSTLLLLPLIGIIFRKEAFGVGGYEIGYMLTVTVPLFFLSFTRGADVRTTEKIENDLRYAFSIGTVQSFFGFIIFYIFYVIGEEGVKVENNFSISALSLFMCLVGVLQLFFIYFDHEKIDKEVIDEERKCTMLSFFLIVCSIIMFDQEWILKWFSLERLGDEKIIIYIFSFIWLFFTMFVYRNKYFSFIFDGFVKYYRMIF